MTTSKLLQAIEKQGIKAVYVDRRYTARTDKRELSFIDQAGDAICVRVRSLNDHDDSMTDYHAGVYYDSIKWAVNSLLN